MRRLAANPAPIGAGMNRAFSAGDLAVTEILGRCPRLIMNVAPSALKRNRKAALKM
jgi:hypothetical protein